MWQPWGECEEVCPDQYEGINMMLTVAKGVSVKSYDFDKDGNEITLDYHGIISLIIDSGYTGFIGVEYGGKRLGENKGIHASKGLLLKSTQLVH